ncbi:sensor histidine kinase [Aquincola sp. S2]|uniref:histidine kinase n=1 Tax=Pseudaquabacterium terrae TaxID=2732868 RepID=A0ABX2EPP4_9BURK|nr:sensor histidine kinase [Aquabacterium terrae]NRF70617.1 sensor histidine kinase [Aquabacterium terrae]
MSIPAEMLQRIAGLESFCAQVAHDLRGTLGGIAELAEIARSALCDQDDARLARRALPLIGAQARCSFEMLSALLRLAQAGGGELQPQPIELGTLVAQVIEGLVLAHGAQPLPTVTVEGTPPLHGDPALLHAVMQNLIGNAFKFCAGRSDANVHIEGRRIAEGVLISVRDNGVGFDAARAAELFEPFKRLHGHAFAGTGMGLCIVRQAVQRHGGRIWAESAPGEGACFSFVLPAPPECTPT